MNAAANTTATETATCYVVVTWTAGIELPSVELFTSLDMATRTAQAARAEHEEEIAWETTKAARMAARGKTLTERTPAQRFELKRVRGERAAAMISARASMDFYSQDEADSDNAAAAYADLVRLYLAAA